MHSKALLSGNYCMDLGLHPRCSHSNSLIAWPYPIQIFPSLGMLHVISPASRENYEKNPRVNLSLGEVPKLGTLRFAEEVC